MEALQYVHDEVNRFKAEQNIAFTWDMGRDPQTARPYLTIDCEGRPQQKFALTDEGSRDLRSFLFRCFGLHEPPPDLPSKIWPAIPGPKVLVCLPQRDEVKASYTMSMVNLTMHTAGRLPFLFSHQRASNIAFVRNMLTQVALDSGSDRVLMIDDDMVFPPDALLRLAAHDVDIVGACYVKRAKPHLCLGHTLDGSTTFTGTGLEPMRHMPTGMLMIKTDVFRKVPRPWFSEVQFPWIDMQSDDYYFCDRARENGINIYCDKDLTWEVGHIGEQVFGMYKPGQAPVKAPDWSTAPAAAAAE